MALYAIGDTHLSLGSDKPMDVFGGGWEGYVDKLREGFAPVNADDTVVLCGDLSWGMSLEEARDDFAFLNSELPGEKWLLKGNHDYWWNTAAKMNAFFQANGFERLHILHNNCAYYAEIALCGTRGWFFEENGGPQTEKVFKRELIRLEASLKVAGERSYAFSITRHCIGGIAARKSSICWSGTRCRPVTMATSTAPATGWRLRECGAGWITTWSPRTLLDSVQKKF